MSNRFKKTVHARSFGQKLKGFIGLERIPANLLLVFDGCKHVHTWFMRCPIDVLYLDEDNRLLSFETLEPWKVGHAPKGTISFAECAPGLARELRLMPGDAIVSGNASALDSAFEAASCWFGLNVGTSCIEECWEELREWVFVSAAWGISGNLRGLCRVSKKTNQIVAGSIEVRNPVRPGCAASVQVPRKYLSQPKEAA